MAIPDLSPIHVAPLIFVSCEIFVSSSVSFLSFWDFPSSGTQFGNHQAGSWGFKAFLVTEIENKKDIILQSLWIKKLFPKGHDQNVNFSLY